ncbi:MAG: Hint domain-containing protein [Acidobacteriota bacterium]
MASPYVRSARRSEVAPHAPGLPAHRVRRPEAEGGTRLLTRRYEVLSLAANGDVETLTRVAPATPIFEDAFAAVARGTLIATADGPVAVEDLLPGTRIDTVSNGPQPLLWVGAMTVFPDRGDGLSNDTGTLTRVSADSFGIGRPAPDLVLGPRARILFRSPACRALIGTSEAFAPARAFVDGDQAVQITPVSPVRVYHLCLHGQQVIRANGMEIESYHPGPDPEAMMMPDMLEMFLGLFPHVDRLTDFGPIDIARLTAFELERLRAG